MIERETREIETPVSKAKVVLHTYLTGREFEYSQGPLLQAMKVRAATKEDGVSFGDIDVEKVQETTHRLIEKLVVSVNGNKESVLDLVLDLPNEDYQFVVSEMNDLAKKN